MERIRRLLRFLISLREKICRENSMFLCLISLLTERPMDALKSFAATLLLRIRVLVLYIALQDLVKKITRSV